MSKQINNTIWITLLSLNLLLGQSLRTISFELSDGTPVTLLRQHHISNTNTFHYLPTNLRISTFNGNHEFSFTEFRPDSLSPISGGIMHMLLVWGLDTKQMTEAASILTQKTDSSSFLAGAALIDHDQRFQFIQIISNNNELGELLLQSLRNSSKIPLNAGSKTALSFQFDTECASIMKAAIENPKILSGIMFRMYYTLGETLSPLYPPVSHMIEGSFDKWVEQLKQ